jgi:hypothetical protein
LIGTRRIGDIWENASGCKDRSTHEKENLEIFKFSSRIEIEIDLDFF